MADRICPRVEGERYIDDARLNSGVPELQAMCEATLQTLEVVSVDGERWYSVPAMIDRSTKRPLLWSTISIAGAETRRIEWYIFENTTRQVDEVTPFVFGEEIMKLADGSKMHRTASVDFDDSTNIEKNLAFLNAGLVSTSWRQVQRIAKGNAGKDSFDTITDRMRGAFAGRPFVFPVK